MCHTLNANNYALNPKKTVHRAQTIFRSASTRINTYKFCKKVPTAKLQKQQEVIRKKIAPPLQNNGACIVIITCSKITVSKLNSDEF